MIRSFPPHPIMTQSPRGEGRPFIPPAELGGILEYFDKQGPSPFLRDGPCHLSAITSCLFHLREACFLPLTPQGELYVQFSPAKTGLSDHLQMPYY